MAPTQAPDVRLRRMTAADVSDVVAVAVAGAEPLEVMPPDEDPDLATWTAARRERMSAFLASRLRPLPDGRSERSFLIVHAGATAGVARIVDPLGDEGHEIGIWLAREHRGRGVGGAAVRLLAEEAGGDSALVASTTTANAPARAILRRLGADTTRRPDDGDAIEARIEPRRPEPGVRRRPPPAR